MENGAQHVSVARARHTADPHDVDVRYMAQALALARKGLGRTSPNPTVGAVLVKDGRIVGQGFHRRAGASHAEVEALRQAGRQARGATLYVTLEPCDHIGRTPPCCDALIAAGIARVVAAMTDPNPITNGRGLARLRRAGIRVATGVLQKETQHLNEPFRKAMTTGLPWVVAKVGQSLDGKIATRTGESRWITSPAARRLAHQWRSRVDAILVGVNTILRDDPELAVRGAPHRAQRPIKVIVDSHLRTPIRARCLSSHPPAPTIIATTGGGGAKQRGLAQRGVEVWRLPARGGRVPLRSLYRQLVRRGVQSVLMEGGGEVLASALEDRLIDYVVFFMAPRLIGGREAPSALGGRGASRLANAVQLADMTVTRVGRDLCVEARVVYP